MRGRLITIAALELLAGWTAVSPAARGARAEVREDTFAAASHVQADLVSRPARSGWCSVSRSRERGIAQILAGMWEFRTGNTSSGALTLVRRLLDLVLRRW